MGKAKTKEKIGNKLVIYPIEKILYREKDNAIGQKDDKGTIRFALTDVETNEILLGTINAMIERLNLVTDLALRIAHKQEGTNDYDNTKETGGESSDEKAS